MLTLCQINNIIDSYVTIHTPRRFISPKRGKCFIYKFIHDFFKHNEVLDKSTVIIALIYLHR